MIDVEIGIYAHRWSHWQVRCAESVARHTHRSYRLIQITDPGSAHVNINRVLEAASARYLILMDEDASLTQDDWLEAFLDTIKRDDVGMVGCFAKRTTYQQPPDLKTHVVPWTPGYFMGFDRKRTPDIRADEAIPGANGMTDVDICMQLRQMDLLTVQDNRIQVYHPQRDEDEIRKIEERPTMKQQALWYHEQINYMRQKWGPDIDRFLRMREPITVSGGA